MNIERSAKVLRRLGDFSRQAYPMFGVAELLFCAID